MNAYEQRRENQRAWSRELAKVRPLRDRVNSLLKRTGIPHRKVHTTSVAGWHDWSAGWFTESMPRDPKSSVVVDVSYAGSEHLLAKQNPDWLIRQTEDWNSRLFAVAMVLDSEGYEVLLNKGYGMIKKKHLSFEVFPKQKEDRP